MTNEQLQFCRDYFIQTRKEVDNEKHERDSLLNFVVAAIGAFGFAIFKDFTPEKFAATLKGGLPVGLAVCGVAFITVVIAIRYQKLRQIADRWVVLNEMLKNVPSPTGSRETLESAVCRKFQNGDYQRKDQALLIVLSLPFYLVLVQQASIIPLLLATQFLATCLLFRWTVPFCEKSEAKQPNDVPVKRE